MVGKQKKKFTTDEFYDEFGWECERCEYFDIDSEKCTKGKRPRVYSFVDGPNEICHAIRLCELFVPWVDEDSMSESIKARINFALNSGSQQYS